MEQMSHSISQQHSSSHQHRRHWTLGSQKEDPQASSHCGEPESVLTEEGPQATSCHRGTVRGWAQSSSPSWQKLHVTFAEGKVPSLSEDSLESNAGIDEAHQLPLPTWQDNRAPNDGANWSRPKAGKEEDFECPPPLEPHLQELLGGEESFLASAKAPYDPAPSPLHQSDWIQWHACQVEMLAWWRELLEVTSNDDCQEFAQKVCTSFEVPMAHNWAKVVDNDYTPMPAHPSLWKYRFIPSSDPRFGSQDCQLAQPHQTLAYVRAIHYWVEKAQLPIPSEPCHLVERGALAGHGAAGLLYRGGSFHSHCSLQLVAGQFDQAGGTCPMRHPPQPQP